MSSNDGTIDLLKKLSENDAVPLIILSACIILYNNLAPVLWNLSNSAFPESYSIYFKVIPLASISLIIIIATLIIISNLLSKFLKNKDTVEEDDMAIIKLGTFNQKNLDNLINQFESSHIQAKRLAARMRQWKSGGDLELQDKLDLAKWCNISDDTRKQGREIARKISILVFGKDISKK